jgi:glycosyltransferase involved in cell wall biosynthesis
MPLLSIVIPTLNRPDTLRHAVTTLLAQSGADCEFIIQNNGANSEISALLNAIDDPRLKRFSTPDVLTIRDNWELALDHSTGDYVTFIGDDDGLMPDACEIAADMLKSGQFELLSWAPYAYYWPSYYHPDFRNRLIAAIDFQFTATRVSSRAELARFYRFQAHYARLPMIYNSFVRRDVISRMKAITGRYFHGLGADVASGIANAALTTSFVRLSRPLTMTGLSRHSTGHTYFFEESDALESARGRRDFGALNKDPRLPDLNATPLLLANDMLLLKQLVFPADAGIELNFKGLAQAVATDLNDRPQIYDRLLQAIHRLAELHGFDPAEIIVPARAAGRPALGRGTTVQGPHRVQFLLDGETLGLRTIADAVRVMAQFIPGRDSLDPSALSEEIGVPLLGPGGLDFAHAGTGVGALVEGWSEPEGWGTWSVAKSCALRVRLDPVPIWPEIIEVACRAFLHGRHPRQFVTCRIGTMVPQEWEFSSAAPGGRRSLMLDPAAIGPGGEVTITFTITDPRSPADLGLSADVRPLGIGIEHMRLAT